MSKRTLLVLSVCLLFVPPMLWPSCPATDASPAGPPPAVRADPTDEFDGPSLDPKWSWHNSPYSYDVGATLPGHLHLVSNRRTNFAGGQDNGTLIYQAANGSFSIETRIRSNPQNNFEKAGIMVRQDGNNWVALKYQQEYGAQAQASVKSGGVQWSDVRTAASASPISLRLERDGSTFTTYYSTDGSNWTRQWSASVTLTDIVSVGLLVADGNSNNNYPADFDYFRFGPPNRAPAVDPPFPPITLNEDERSGLRISDHISDPDGDKLVFKLSGAPHITGLWNSTSNDLEILGAPNWHGSEFLTITATDPWGAWVAPQVKVTVNSVEDPPALLKPLPEVRMPQGGTDTSLNLSKHFYDNDTPPNGNDRLNYSVSANGSIRVNITAAGQVTLTGPVIFWGNLNMTFTATDTTGLVASAECKVTVFHVNQPPMVKESYPPLDFEVNEDDSIIRDFSAVFWDPDGDPITLIPSGNIQISVNQAPGTLNLTFAPNPDASGFIEHIKLTAQDDKGLGSNFVFANVRVIPANDAPRITSFSPSADVTITETDSFTFNVTAADPENGEALNYTWRFDGQTVLFGVTSFTYSTNYTSAGVHLVNVEVDDGELTAGRAWNVTVRNLNRPPADLMILSPKPGDVFKHGAAITFNASATDPDGDDLEYRWLEGMTVIGRGQENVTVLGDGTHKIVLEVSDGYTTVRLNPLNPLSITVKVNTSPKIIYSAPSKGQRFEKGQEIFFSVDVKNDDNDQLSYCWTEGGRELSDLPSFALSNLSPGTHMIHLAVSDGLGGMDYLDIEVVVTEPAAAGQNYLLLGGAAAGIILVVAAVAALLIIRRRKEPPLAAVVRPED